MCRISPNQVDKNPCANLCPEINEGLTKKFELQSPLVPTSAARVDKAALSSPATKRQLSNFSRSLSDVALTNLAAASLLNRETLRQQVLLRPVGRAALQKEDAETLGKCDGQGRALLRWRSKFACRIMQSSLATGMQINDSGDAFVSLDTARRRRRRRCVRDGREGTGADCHGWSLFLAPQSGRYIKAATRPSQGPIWIVPAISSPGRRAAVASASASC
jgi:hypothetical protein